MNLGFRKTDDSDALTLATIQLDSYREAYKEIIPSEVLETIDILDLIEHFKKAHQEKIEDSILATVGEESVGFISIGEAKEEDLEEVHGEIRKLYIAPEHFKKGYGKLLMKWALKELEDRQYSKVCLWVFRENEVARKFYEQLGFVHDGATKEYDLKNKVHHMRYIMEL